MNLKKCVQKGLKTRPYSIDMDIATLPKKGLKTIPYNMDMSEKGLKKCDYTIYMDMDVATLPKKGLKTRPYSMDMSKRGLKKCDHTIYMDMEKKDLKKLTKGQLIKLLMNQRNKPTPPPRTGKWESVKPKPVPLKSINEDTILPMPDGYKPIPKPRTDRPLQLEEHITNVSVPKIKELNQALKGHAKSYVIELQDSLNPLNHFTKTKALAKSHFY